MADAELQSLYDEAVKKGLFASDPELAQLGHEARAAGIISDPTQGGLFPAKPSTAPNKGIFTQKGAVPKYLAPPGSPTDAGPYTGGQQKPASPLSLATPQAREANIAQLSSELGITPTEARVNGVNPAVSMVEGFKRAYENNQLSGFLGQSMGNIEDIMPQNRGLPAPGKKLQERNVPLPKPDYRLTEAIQPGTNEAIASIPGLSGIVPTVAGGIVDSLPAMLSGAPFGVGSALASRVLSAGLGASGIAEAVQNPDFGKDIPKNLGVLLGNTALVSAPFFHGKTPAPADFATPEQFVNRQAREAQMQAQPKNELRRNIPMKMPPRPGEPAATMPAQSANTPTEATIPPVTTPEPTGQIRVMEATGKAIVNTKEGKTFVVNLPKDAAQRPDFVARLHEKYGIETPPVITPEAATAPDVPIGTSPIAPEGVPVEKTVPSVATPTAPKTPLETPKVDNGVPRPAAPDAPVEDAIAAKNASTEAIRERFGLLQVEKHIPKEVVQGLQEGQKALEDGTIVPEVLMQDVAREPRALKPKETGALLEYKRRILNEAEASRKALDEAITNNAPSEDRELLRASIKHHMETLDRIDETNTHAGTAWSESGLARQGEMKIDTGNVTQVLRDFRHRLDRELTPDETVKYSRMAEDYKRVTDELARRDAAQTVQVETVNARRTRVRTDLAAERTQLVGQLQKLLSSQRLNIGVSQIPEAAGIIRKIAINYIKDGLTRLPDVVKAVRTDFPTVTDREVHDSLSGYGHETTPRTLTELQQMVKSLKREAMFTSKIEDQKGALETGDIPKARPQVKPVETKETAALKDKSASIDAWKKDILRERVLQAKLKGESARNIPAEVAQEAQDKADIESGAIEPPRQEPTYGSPEVKAAGQSLRDQQLRNAANKKLLKERSGEDTRQTAQERNTPEDIKAANAEINKIRTVRDISAEIADLERQIKDKDYAAPKEKKTRTEDAEVNALRKKRDSLQAQVDRARALLEKPSKWDYLLGWQRANILSGKISAEKVGLASAASAPMGLIEDLLGSPMNLIPGMRKLSDMAPSEGGGVNLRAQFQAFKAAFGTPMETEATRNSSIARVHVAKDMWQALTTAEGNSLDTRFSDKHPPQNSRVLALFNLFGRLHSAVKTPAQRARFFKSMEKRFEYEKRQGNDPANPDVAARIANGAFNDSLRAKFMQPNVVTDEFKASMRRLEAKGKGGIIASKLAQSELPIVRVPLNFAGEQLQYAGGGAYGVVKTALAGGIKNLTPESADAVYRAYKKQGVGAGLFALGYYGVVKSGGAYRKDKAKINNLEPGEVELFGHKIDPRIAHLPGMIMITAGAQTRYVQQHNQSLGQAAVEVGAGAAEAIPFFGETVRWGRGFESEGAMGKLLGQRAASFTEPRLIQEIAADTDKRNGKPIPRKPKGFKDTLRMGVPKQLPIPKYFRRDFVNGE